MGQQLQSSPRAIVFSTLVLDLVAIVAFAAVGRASHHETVFGIGLAETAWPFVVGLLGGWLLARGWLAPTNLLRTALPVWVTTIVLGMALRELSGQGVQLAFVIVATIVVGLFLVAVRLIVKLFTSLARASQTDRQSVSSSR